MSTRLKRPAFWRYVGLSLILVAFQGYLGYSYFTGKTVRAVTALCGRVVLTPPMQVRFYVKSVQNDPDTPAAAGDADVNVPPDAEAQRSD